MTPKEFLNEGIAIIPIGYRSKRPHSVLKNGWKEYQTRLPTNKEFQSWQGGMKNWAVICGWQNLVIVDFDNISAHDLWLSTYGVNGYADTYTVTTGRGFHYYFYVENPPCSTKKWAGGEIKATGYCLIPPSVHPSRRQYTAVASIPIMTLGSIDDILPTAVFQTNDCTPKDLRPFDPFNPSLPAMGSFAEAREQNILQFFDTPLGGHNGYYQVFCPFHGDGKKRGKRSGWVDSNKNRFGCHVCKNGTLGAVDFYAELKGVDHVTAVRELVQL